jgi:hypothetical protein
LNRELGWRRAPVAVSPVLMHCREHRRYGCRLRFKASVRSPVPSHFGERPPDSPYPVPEDRSRSPFFD